MTILFFFGFPYLRLKIRMNRERLYWYDDKPSIEIALGPMHIWFESKANGRIVLDK